MKNTLVGLMMSATAFGANAQSEQPSINKNAGTITWENRTGAHILYQTLSCKFGTLTSHGSNIGMSAVDLNLGSNVRLTAMRKECEKFGLKADF